MLAMCEEVSRNLNILFVNRTVFTKLSVQMLQGHLPKCIWSEIYTFVEWSLEIYHMNECPKQVATIF